MLNSQDEIRKFLLLQQKTIDDLVVIAGELLVDTEGKDKVALIHSIIDATTEHKKVNHIIALASNKNEYATKMLKNIRDDINKQNQQKVFNVPTMDGSTYQEKMKFILASPAQIDIIRDKKLTYRDDKNINNLISKVSEFKTYFVIKQSGKNHWLMLFLEN
jgi:hypothetical protein